MGRTERVKVGGELFDEVRVKSRVLQESVLGPILFLAHVNDVCENTESTSRFSPTTV
jgi:hypothetical protein